MNHLVVMPVVLPALAAALLLLLRPAVRRQRRLSLAVCAALLGVSAWLAVLAARGGYLVYALGDWPAPFGIVLVLDRLAAAMLLLTSIIAAASLLHAMRGRDEAGGHYHALFMFQLMGVNGAFLTGDLFNLFVFFEVLLIASYCLLLHGGGSAQLLPGLHYVAINFTGSFLFLVGVSMLYALTGTLNMADLAQKVAVAPATDAALIRAAALLLLLVFAVKAALFPLYFWLPRAYSAAEAPVAALFAIMTKIGVYAILRIATLVFGPAAGVAAGVYEAWLLPVALMTVAVATFGVLAGQTLRTMAGYLNIASVGIICTGIGLFSGPAIAAALYYLLHSTLAISLLFLLVDLVRSRRSDGDDRIARGAAPANATLLGLLFLGAAVAAVGLPPLSGFLGKTLLLQAAQQHDAAALIWTVTLGNALLALVAMARAGSLVFWHTAAQPAPAWRPARALAADALPALLLLGCIVALSAAAGPAADYTAAAARQLLQPAGYIDSVLQSSRAAAGAGGGGQ